MIVRLYVNSTELEDLCTFVMFVIGKGGTVEPRHVSGIKRVVGETQFCA